MGPSTSRLLQCPAKSDTTACLDNLRAASIQERRSSCASYEPHRVPPHADFSVILNAWGIKHVWHAQGIQGHMQEA
eukprot:scaffold140830_cov18-Tisochrysis_lutea.AAC.1